MFSLLKYLYSHTFPPSISAAEKIRSYYDIIDDIDREYEAPIIPNSDSSFIPDGQFFRRQGRITHLYSNDGFIDDNIFFSREMARNLDIKEGFTVEYIARKLSNDMPVSVYLIKSIVSEDWDNNVLKPILSPPKPDSAVSTHEKILMGSVMDKKGGLVTIETVDENAKFIEIKLSEIVSEFVPMVGDNVSLLALFETDASVLNFTGKPIGVYKLMAENSKVHAGKIVKFHKNKEYGIIDKEYIFFFDALRHSDNAGFVPDVGDEVIAEVISCYHKIDFKTFNWRCTKIIRNSNYVQQEGAEKPVAKQYTYDENINDIWITGNDELTASFNNLNESKTIQLTIQNSAQQAQTVRKATVNEGILSSQINCTELHKAHVITANGKYTYEIEVRPKLYGNSRVSISFDFGHFSLARCIEIDVKGQTPAASEQEEVLPMVNVTYNKQYTKNMWTHGTNAVPGVRPVVSPHFIYKRLKPFEVSKSLINIVLETLSITEIDERLTEVLTAHNHLDSKNYERYFHDLLHLEEIHLNHELHKYDRERAYFTREGEYLALHIPNISESRPSLTIGDVVIASSPWKGQCDNSQRNGDEYQGVIHKVKCNRLLIKFHNDFHCRYSGEDYSLVFKFSRSSFIKQHNAIENVCINCDPQMLFPSRIRSEKHLQLNVSLVNGELEIKSGRRRVKWHNKNLNDGQKEAIKNILLGEARPIPYVIFGPPGTGKTSTVVELILQIFRCVGGSRILVAAPSNSAANLITKRLIESETLILGEFVRIVGHSSLERELIPDELHPYCATVDIATPGSQKETTLRTKSGLTLNVHSTKLSSHRILISTCSSFGSLLCMKFPPRHFTHVIIDEAGQCTEPEAIIPISLITKHYSQVILAGDPMQLGPIVLSPFAKHRGLDKSLLARLLDRIPYQRGVDNEDNTFDPRLVTKLAQNYRALPSIMSIYSNLFYHSELIETINESDSGEIKLLRQLKENKILPHSDKTNENFAVYFYGLRGREEQSTESSSWRNICEANAIQDMLNKMLKAGVKHTDIGIITPYTLQVRDIRDLCKYLEIEEIPKIGTVEEFQGQERDIIMISTVRSTLKCVQNDLKYNLGFIQNPRRMNVAISRARAVLIVFGNPELLIIDRNWRELIVNCYKNGTYFGCDFKHSTNSTQ